MFLGAGTDGTSHSLRRRTVASPRGRPATAVPLSYKMSRSVRRPPVTTRGVLYVHSAPRALCPHVEWAVAGVLGTRVNLDWIRQPAAPGTWRSEFSWKGEVGTASSWPPRCAAGRCCASRSPPSPAPPPRASATAAPRTGHLPRRHRNPRRHPDPRGPSARRPPALPARRERPGVRPRQTPGQALGRRAGTLPLRRRGSPGPLAPPGGLTLSRPTHPHPTNKQMWPELHQGVRATRVQYSYRKSQTVRNASTTLCPPNPNESFRAAMRPSTGSLRASRARCRRSPRPRGRGFRR